MQHKYQVTVTVADTEDVTSRRIRQVIQETVTGAVWAETLGDITVTVTENGAENAAPSALNAILDAFGGRPWSSPAPSHTTPPGRG